MLTKSRIFGALSDPVSLMSSLPTWPIPRNLASPEQSSAAALCRHPSTALGEIATQASAGKGYVWRGMDDSCTNFGTIFLRPLWAGRKFWFCHHGPSHSCNACNSPKRGLSSVRRSLRVEKKGQHRELRIRRHHWGRLQDSSPRVAMSLSGRSAVTLRCATVPPPLLAHPPCLAAGLSIHYQ